MKRTLYIILFMILFLVSLLPFWILYGISDLLYLIAYHVWGYRKALVRKQLNDSFPEQTESERRKIERDYYHWFCDYIVETLKLFSISRKNLMRRMRFVGTERVEESFRQNQNVVVYLGHYCNWEWVTSTPLCFEQHLDRVTFGQIYHKLENESMNNLILRLLDAWVLKASPCQRHCGVSSPSSARESCGRSGSLPTKCLSGTISTCGSTSSTTTLPC